ncbi:iron(III) transport system permease protein [Rhodobacter capsulatus]|uniref:ABC transporter permease n=1 Tax=Rhodobacter capsulatus TaxID=1061 RepID=UPI0006DCB07A|nr:iron ABC transporter permease [Rhodobacter capsulatus]KQB15175.1 iron ABC transporter permease [Rhodobacter capsulatus]KQB16892.1 iron ABC transporter permease [Rhodobacter capsulatus]PZX23682.1 iron(III) transport system permease protein [Rhodobacter capsulatus]
MAVTDLNPRLPGRLRTRPLMGGGSPWLWAAGGIAALVLAPVAALLWQAAQGSNGLWNHLWAYVLAPALGQTALLLAGVGLVVTVLGTALAWLVAAHAFPGRRLLDWALLLPLAVPSYIIAFVYLEVTHPLGPLQDGLRALLGYTSPREFRLPDIRSLPGAIFLLGLVLYPYVYLPVRAMFAMQAAGLLEAGRMLGCTRRGLLWRLALPLARPAIAAGASLALMETLNDIGAAEFLGVRTLTVSIYATWVTRSDLPGAAQIALVMLAVVAALVALERFARRRQRFAGGAQRMRPLVPVRLTGLRGWAALGLGLVPVLLGFGVPLAWLLSEAVTRIAETGISAQLRAEMRATLLLATAATVAVVAGGLVVALTARLCPGGPGAVIGRLASLGYAMPGTVVALGVLVPVGALDRLLDAGARAVLGQGTGLVLIGSGLALGYAYLVRFLAIAVGGCESGLAQIPSSLDQAARSLGHGPAASLRRLHLPLLRPALIAAALLVFVDTMKELSATLLLRPLGVETLATHLYGEAARGSHEDGAIAGLAIVAVGILPVIALSRLAQRRGI